MSFHSYNTIRYSTLSIRYMSCSRIPIPYKYKRTATRWWPYQNSFKIHYINIDNMIIIARYKKSGMIYQWYLTSKPRNMTLHELRMSVVGSDLLQTRRRPSKDHYFCTVAVRYHFENNSKYVVIACHTVTEIWSTVRGGKWRSLYIVQGLWWESEWRGQAEIEYGTWVNSLRKALFPSLSFYLTVTSKPIIRTQSLQIHTL